MKQGYVVLLNFPFSNRETSKVRPALVISNDKFNKNGNDIIILGITSQKSGRWHSIKLQNSDLKKGELKKESYIKCNAVLSVEKSIVLKTVAIISDKKLSEVIKTFRLFFSLQNRTS